MACKHTKYPTGQRPHLLELIMHKHYSIRFSGPGFDGSDWSCVQPSRHWCIAQTLRENSPFPSLKTDQDWRETPDLSILHESPRAFGWRVFCAFTVQSVTGHVVLPTSSSARWMACQQLPQKMLQHACSGCLPTVCGAFGDSTSSMIPKRCSRRRHKGRAVACS